MLCSFVQVTFVDFGHVAVVPLINLRPIYDDLMKLPSQVVECWLDDVNPSDTHTYWTEGINNFHLIDHYFKLIDLF